ncbi:AI-2E family transporter [Novosphingobium rosa]|uniref:AI-2E family transporter n=1 Tax=Novosphingobium rosa TaxID=76978 RepID=UPI000ADCC436|nr:AI-2E family transporter [Novosphingobium rosa]
MTDAAPSAETPMQEEAAQEEAQTRDHARKPGPTDIADPQVRAEARRAFIWLGIAALMALSVVLAQPLIVVFGGIVFGAMIDGGARLLGKVLPIPRIWRVVLVLLFAVAFLMSVVAYAGSQIAAQAAALPATLSAQAFKILHWADQHGIQINTRMRQTLTERALGGINELPGLLGGFIGGATTLFLILVLGIYFAVDPAPYQRGLAWMLPRESRPAFNAMFQAMGHTLRRLLFGRIIGMTVEGVTIGLALQLGGVPMATLLGLLSGMLAFLPNIGAPISGLLMVLVGFSGGPSMGLYCVAVYVVVQGIDGNVIVPMVAKKTADLAPALVLGMQLVMGALFGIIGLALADPMLAMIKVLLERLAARREAGQDESATAGA